MSSEAFGKFADDEHAQMVEDCEHRESRLSEWERGFIQSCRERLNKGQPLTPPMMSTLDDVWERATARG